MEIQDYIKARKTHIESILKTQLEQVAKHSNAQAADLHSAMAYSTLVGGKRLRPILAYASAEALGGSFEQADIPACSVELIHTYSLIHDDLPAMDDDSLRRGNPTCHVAFDEATAILAGDALQALAFELMAGSMLLKVSDSDRLKMIALLSKAIGGQGMVAGQSVDIKVTGLSVEEETLAQMHGLKTGALINASVQLGALSTGLAQPELLLKLEHFSSCIGLAFQIQDDILDVEGDTQTLGKQQGQDQLLNKATYTSILGLEGAKKKAQALCEESISALSDFGDDAKALVSLAQYIIQRRY